MNLTPSDSTTILAAHNNGRLNIVFKLQQCSVRSPHIDAHYGLALQKYGRDWFISINAQLAKSGTPIDMITSADDKALIIVGEPGHALAQVAHMRTAY